MFHIQHRRYSSFDDQDDDFSIFDDSAVEEPNDFEVEEVIKKPTPKATPKPKPKPRIIKRVIPKNHKKPRTVHLPDVVTPKSLSRYFGVRAVDVLKLINRWYDWVHLLWI